jgi:hypothetical protein
MTPPYSIATAPVFTRKPSTSMVEARPPTRSRVSTTSTRSPACARRAAAQRPPTPAPITSASYRSVTSVLDCSVTSVLDCSVTSVSDCSVTSVSDCSVPSVSDRPVTAGPPSP